MDTINRWKRLATGVVGIAAAIAAVPDTRAEIVNVPAGNLQGEHLWVSTNTYVLQGFVYAVEGAVLRIEPGTVVKGVPGTTSANFGNLFICRGARIFAEGTPQNPIIFTAEEDDVTDPTDLGPDDTQLWGGLIVFGKARINAAVNAAGDASSPKYDIYEGLPDNQAANGQFVNRFGGGDDDDSSGVIRYVSIRHGGKLLESNKEVNGLSLCGVGRGTKVEYVEVFANSDDGFEFFGGSVNTRYLVSAFNQDEQFDADQGYNGKNQFWFGIQPAGSVEKGMEINGEPQDRITGSGVPVSNWEVYNATTIGAGARTGSGSGNNAFTLRANTQVGIYNGIFTDFNGLPVTGSNFTTGAKPTVQNNLWWNFTVPTFGPAAAFDGSQGNVTNVNPNLRGISRVADGGLDPRPAAGSLALRGAVTPPDNGFYTKTSFVGAFDHQNLWLRHWTMLDKGGFLPAQTNIVDVPAGYLTGEHVWSSTNVYVLQGFVYLVEGAVLRIEPGTVIKGVPGTTSANFGNLFVCRGAKIFAEGTPQNPIIFTAEEDDVTDPTDLGPDDTQLWGGMIVFGNARINAAVNAAGDAASPKYDIYEGLPDVQASNGQFVNRFGGGNDDDSSGVIRYVSIRHGGKLLESNKEVNGLSLCGVGRGTQVEFVEVFANSDDGFEFFGGSVNTRFLVSAFNQDEQFDADQGYNGRNQFWFGIQPAASVEKGMEINGEPQDRITGSGVPVSNWEVYNATTIGAGARTGSGSGNNAFTLRANTQVGIYNGIFTDFNGLPVTGSNFTTGAKPTLQDNLWWGFTVPTFGPAAAFAAGQGNLTNVNPEIRGISRTANWGLDPRPATGSPANVSQRIAPANGFYADAKYYGAFTSGGNWVVDWTAIGNSGIMSPSGAYNPVALPREPDAPLKSALIKPTETLPVTLPNGSVTFGAPGSMTVAGPGLVAWAAASNADQPGDVQEFAYEEITGDFDISTKVTSVTSGPVTDPVDAWASGGLQARASLDAISPSFMVNVANPKGVNEVRSIGRAIAAQNYTTFGRTYPGVDKTLPSQWIRLRRVGNWFAAYVGTDGSSWALVGQRWQEWPDKLLVGAYAFSASYNSADQTGGKNLSTVAFSNYGKTVQNDNVAPALVSAATMGKKVVGVKFSEPVASSGALVAANYTISQGAVTAVQGGIGGDSVYLTVSGLTADTFEVTVNNVTDTAGNALPAGSKVTGRSSAWKSADIGLIQSGNPEVRTAGDDPYRIGQAVAVASGSTETEIEIIGGGSNAWNPGDYIHYVSGIPLVGDFEVTVEVSRNDRPANTAAWANSGLMLRESEYVPGQQYTQDGTKVAMVANTTYIEGSAPNRAGIPLWREEPGAGYGNGNPGFAWTTPIGGIKGYYLDQRAIDAAGTPDPESSPLSSRWLRIKRAGNDFSFFVSYDGWEWALLDGPKTLPLSTQLLFGFSTMSDTGSGVPPNNAYGGNGFLGTDLEGQQNPSNYSVQRIRIGTNVTPRGPGPVTPTVSIQGSTVTFTGKLQEASSLNGPFTEVQGAKSPYTIPVGSEIRFYRASN